MARRQDQDDRSPLRAERLRRRLTIGRLAQLARVSKAAISLAERGFRTPPKDVLLILGGVAGVEQTDELGKRQAEWAARHRPPPRKSPSFSFTHNLPGGVGRGEARRACLEAIRSLAKGASK